MTRPLAFICATFALFLALPVRADAELDGFARDVERGADRSQRAGRASSRCRRGRAWTCDAGVPRRASGHRQNREGGW